MSPRGPWLSFERQGGAAPRDDEELRLAEDGSFTALRTIGGPCIGSFEGRLPAAVVRKFRTAIEALGTVEDVEIPTPRHGATETLIAGGRTLRTGSNETPRGPWRALLALARTVFEREVIEHPRAAVRIVADASTARLEHAGDGPIDVDLGTLEVRVVLLGADDAVRGRWAGRPTEGLVDNGETIVATPAWATAAPGWSAELPYAHGFSLEAGAWLQVWVDLAVRADGRRRAGRLYRPVIPDA